MAFTKITDSDLANKGVVGLPDTPNLSTGEMQRKFDEIATDVIVPKFNELAEELDEIGLDKVTTSNDVTDFKLDDEGRLMISTNHGVTFGYAGSTGHQIVDSLGTKYPARPNLQFSQNVTIVDYDENNGNKTYISAFGEKGEPGKAATITIGNVESGDEASVVNVGSDTDAIFNMTFPKGEKGDAATIQLGTITSGENASVTNRGTSAEAIFDFVLPKGEKGDTGTSLNYLGRYDTIEELQEAHPTGSIGDAYVVGKSEDGETLVTSISSNSIINDSTNGNINSIKLIGNSYKSSDRLIIPSGDVVTHSKNLASTMEQGDLSNTDGSKTDDGSTKHIRSVDYIPIEPNKTYTFSYTHNYRGSGTFKVMAYTSTKSFIKRVNLASTNQVFTFNAESNMTFVKLGIYDESGVKTTETLNIQLEEGSKTDYVPYGYSSVHTDRPLLSVGNIKNELVINADGTGKYIQRVASVDLSSLNWTYESSWGSGADFYTQALNGIAKNPANNSSVPNFVFENYETKSRDDFYDSVGAIGMFNAGVLKVRATSNTDTPKGNAIYELATPTTTDLSIEEVAEMLSLKTYKGQTYIDTDGAEFEISYFVDNNIAKAIADSKGYTSEVAERVEEIASISDEEEISATDFWIPSNGISINADTSRIYRKGNHIFGNLNLMSTSALTTSALNLGNVNQKYKWRGGIVQSAFGGKTKWAVNSILYCYMGDSSISVNNYESYPDLVHISIPLNYIIQL